MTIAVTAAAGQLGHIVIDKLKQKVSAGDLLALVRRPEQTEVLGAVSYTHLTLPTICSV